MARKSADRDGLEGRRARRRSRPTPSGGPKLASSEAGRWPLAPQSSTRHSSGTTSSRPWERRNFSNWRRPPSGPGTASSAARECQARSRQERSSERPMFTLAQVQALADAVEDRWRALILLAAWTDLRIGELSALRREHLDLKAGTVNVKSAVIDVIGQGRSYGPPKSAAGRRAVAIPPHIIGELEHHLSTYAEPGARGLVFRGAKGRTDPAQQLRLTGVGSGSRGGRTPARLSPARPARLGRHRRRPSRRHHQGVDAPTRARLPRRGPPIGLDR